MPLMRGCGLRELGGLYVEVDVDWQGQSLWDFVVDPMQAVPEGLRLPNRGVELVEINGVTHIVDRVGVASYPNVADILVEGLRHGFSRRVQRTLDFSRLSQESRLILVHPRAFIDNVVRWLPSLQNRQWTPDCPTGRHASGGRLRNGCCALWWRDLDPATVQTPMPNVGGFRALASGEQYYGYARPDGVTPRYKDGFVASLPISRIAAVVGNQRQGAEPWIEDVMALSGIMVQEVAE